MHDGSSGIRDRSEYRPLRAATRAATRAAGAGLAAIAAVVYTISFAAVAYGGALAPFLDRGIGLVLIGSAAATVIVGLTASARGMVAHPQEAPLLLVASVTPSLLAAATAAGAPPGAEAQFATFAVFLMCSTGLTGLLLILAGKLRLSLVARYLPYPVVGGVIVSIGYLLVISSLSLVMERTVDIYTLPRALAEGSAALWAPWAAGAVALLLAGRWLPATTILPVGLLLAFAAFHLALRAAGWSLADAEAAGLLLGPFPAGGFLDGVSPDILQQAEWGAVAAHLPILAALAPVSALNALIHVQAICRATGGEPDLDRALVSNGLANVAGAGAGGLVSFPAISTSLLAERFGTGTLLVCAATAGLSLGVALLGADLLGALPRGLLAMLILYLGLDMLVSTLAVEWRRLPARDLAPILAILATTVLVGLFQGLALGVVLSVFLFVVCYARLPFIRSDTTLALRRSIVERGERERLTLTRHGHRVRILEISGYLFFGTAHALRERVRELIGPGAPAEVLVLDFGAVRDIDASAIASLDRTQQECRMYGVEVYLTGLSDVVARRLRDFGFEKPDDMRPPLRRAVTLDDALERIEDAILARHGGAPGGTASETFLTELAAAVPEVELSEAFETLSLEAGATLIEQGAPSSEIFVLLEGRARAVLGAGSDDELVVARFEPGALIGEMAFYQQAARSATVVTEAPSRLLRIEAGYLEGGGRLPDALLAAFHRIAARHLSQRLDRVTTLLRDARP